MSVLGLQSRAGKIFWVSVIGVLSYVGFLIAHMPANNLWQVLPVQNLPVQLYGITGTPWAGSAEQVTIKNGARNIVLPQISWQVTVPQLLLGRLVMDVTIGHASAEIAGQGKVQLTKDSLSLADVELDTTLTWLLAASGTSLPGHIAGVVTLDLQQAVLTQEGCSVLDGNVELNSGEFVSIIGRLDLGSGRAQLVCDNRNLVATYEQNSSLFSWQGDLRVDPQGNYVSAGQLTPEVNISPAMRQGLMLFGQPNRDGIYDIQQRGRLL